MIGSKDFFLELQNDVENQISDYYNGQVNVLDLLIDFREKKEIIEKALSFIKDFEKENMDAIENEASKYNNHYQGFDVVVRSGRRLFDFSKISEIKNLKAKLKEREEFYKQNFEARQKGLLTASQDGEEVELPEVNYTAGYVEVKRAK